MSEQQLQQQQTMLPFGPVITPGTYVVCDFRMPPAHQPWTATIPVGLVEYPSEEHEEGRWSEREYCERTNRVRVHYRSPAANFITCDPVERLIPLTIAEASLSQVDLKCYLLGPEARAYYYPEEQQS